MEAKLRQDLDQLVERLSGEFQVSTLELQQIVDATATRFRSLLTGPWGAWPQTHA